MKKRLLAIITLMFPLFIIASCDYTTKAATFHIYNNSQFEVTEISVPARSMEQWFQEILEPGENCTLVTEWVESETSSIQLTFYINGEDYGTREREEAAMDTRRYKSYKRIKNGDTITVKIYDDHWEW
jgi:hypothetical protein